MLGWRSSISNPVRLPAFALHLQGDGSATPCEWGVLVGGPPHRVKGPGSYSEQLGCDGRQAGACSLPLPIGPLQADTASIPAAANSRANLRARIIVRPP